MATLKPGTRLRSATDSTEVVVVRAPAEPVDLRCGGRPMVDVSDATGEAEPDPSFADGTLLGKRYAHEDTGLEVLCTKAGAGSLSLGDEPLHVKGAKPLPSSD